MKTVELKAKVREGVGKGVAKKLRAQGVIPAIVYGSYTKPVAIQVNTKDFYSVTHTQAGGNVLIHLKIEGATKGTETVLIKEIQHDPVSDSINHIDFNVVSLTEKTKAKVHIHEKGEPAGVKEGGVLDHAHREIEVECLPTQIPDRIEVNVESLKINDAIHVKDLVLPEGVRCLLDPEEVILKVLPPAKEEVAAEAVPGEAAAEPEVITAKKPAEGETAEAEKAAPKKEAAPKKAEAKPAEKK
jgi:large subunit ribosomal protein L25